MRVLLVRLDGIGDAAVCAPLLLALRDAGHEVGAALTTRNAGLFAPGALIAEHVLERIPWPKHGSTPASTARAQREIAALRYDAALVASEEPEAYALAKPIPRRVGFVTARQRPLKTLWARMQLTDAVDRSQRVGRDERHEADVLFSLGQALARRSRRGVTQPHTAPRAPAAEAGSPHFTAPSRDASRLRTLFTGSGEPPRRGGLVLQAGPKWASSGVPASALAVVARALEARGRRVLAAPADAAAVASALGVAPETPPDLRAWVAALDAAETVITTDTGAAHVAGMLGVPVVDVFPDPHFAEQVRRWSPWASPYAALRASAVAGAPVRAIEAALDELRAQR